MGFEQYIQEIIFQLNVMAGGRGREMVVNSKVYFHFERKNIRILIAFCRISGNLKKYNTTAVPN